MLTRRDIGVYAEISKRELITALKMRHPGNVHLQALPEDGHGVEINYMQNSLSVKWTKQGTAQDGSAITA